MRIFIAGIMQGNRSDRFIDDQSYRTHITEVFQSYLPEAQIIDPFALHPYSVDYDEDKARHTFLGLTRQAGQVDLLIAYLPKASMGTAMEMWQAYQNNTYIIAVTPLLHNWAIRFTAHEILPDLDTLIVDIKNGRIAHILETRAVDALSITD